MGILGDIGNFVGDALGGVGDALGGLVHGVGKALSNPYVDAAALAAFGIADPSMLFGSLGAGAGAGGELATGAFLGEGVASGVGAWDAAAAMSALGSGAIGTGLGYLASDPGAALSLFGRGATSLLSAGGGSTGTGAASGIGTMGNIFDIGKGVYGLNLARQLRDRSDPFAKYRGGYGERLAALEANPNSITTLPGYEAGLEATRRAAAAGGYAGSGNELAALAKYGGDFFNQTAQRYAGLAGAGQSPGAGDAQAALLASGALKSASSGLYGILGGR